MVFILSAQARDVPSEKTAGVTRVAFRNEKSV